MSQPRGRSIRYSGDTQSKCTAGTPHFSTHNMTTHAFESTEVLLGVIERRKADRSILTIKVALGQATNSQVSGRVHVPSSATSWGGAEMQLPCPVTHHHGLPADERGRRGIPDSTIRLPLGREATVDPVAELDPALTVVTP